jgi:cyclopropane-fatty-acyl-phospholipid synthase
MSSTSFGISAAEKGWVPTFVLRRAIRSLLDERLRSERAASAEAAHLRVRALIKELNESPIAINTAEANHQHYEVPTEFYKLCLGPRLKYSSGYWSQGVSSLAQAEEAMLALYAERAELKDGQSILDMGCGWGSLSLWLCEKFPSSKVVAVSNSATQRQYIERVAAERGFANLRVITCDMRVFDPGQQFDRIVSVEMLEHMRNYRALFERVASWLHSDGKFFVHIFTHAQYAYPFQDEGEDDWMARHFFTGGIMPSDHLLFAFQEHLRMVDHWRVDGTHYGKTAGAWLSNVDANKEKALALFEKESANSPVRAKEDSTPRKHAIRQYNRWRLFYLACEELWNYANGREWMVSHYLMTKR